MDVIRCSRFRSALCVFLFLVAFCALLTASTDFVVPPGADAYPYDITRGPDGNLWVLEANRNSIAKVTPAGVFTEYNIPGLSYNTSLYSSRIISGPLGLLWFNVSDFSSSLSLIGSIDPATGTINLYQATVTFTYGLSSYTYPAYPQDLTVGPDGALWFTSGYYGYPIERFDPVTHNIGSVNIPSGTCAGNIVTGSDKNLWFLNLCAQYSGGNYFYSVVRITTGGVGTVFPLPNNNNYPQDIAAGPDGNLWITDSYNDAIYKVTTSGTVQQYSLIKGTAPNQVRGEPSRIVVGPDGNLWFKEYIVDPPNNYSGYAVGSITPAGVVTQGLPALENQNFGYAQGLTAGPDNLSIWTADGYYSSVASIHRISTTTHAVTNAFTPPPGSHPTSITTGPDGNLWFLEPTANKVGMITPSGIATSFPIPTPASRAQQITAGPAGTVWFTELGPTDANGYNQAGKQKIARVDTNTGNILEFPIAADASCIPSYSSAAMGIVMGPDKNLWVGDGNCGNLVRFAPNGASAPAETPFPLPVGEYASFLAVGSDGNIWYLDWDYYQVNYITPGASPVLGNPIPLTPNYVYNYGVLTLGSDNNIWFGPINGTNLSGLGRVTPSGVVTPFDLSGTGFQISTTDPSLVSGADGSLWSNTYYSTSINAVNTQGQFELYAQPSTQGYSDTISGITSGPDQRLWVSENQSGRIGRLSAIAGVLTLSPVATQSGVPVTVLADFKDGTPGVQVSDLSASGIWTDSSGNTVSTFTAPIINNGGISFSVLVDPITFSKADFYTLQLTLHDKVDNQDYIMKAVANIGSDSKTTVTVSPNPASAGSLVTFTAHVTGPGGIPTGTVTFCCDSSGATIGTAQLDGTGLATLSTSTLPLGHSYIQATYPGDANFRPSSSNYYSLDVLQASGDLFPNNALSLPVPIATPYALAVGDVNGDGIPDVVVANDISQTGAFSQGLWYVLKGNGDGTLSSYGSYGATGEVQSIALGDFNNDGKLDVVVTSRIDDANDTGQTDQVLVSTGDGTGYFSQQTPLIPVCTAPGTSPCRPISVAVGDFNRDGKLDIAVLNRDGEGLNIFLNTTPPGSSTLSFAPAVNYQLSVPFNQLAVADVDGNGTLDIYATFPTGVYWSSGNGDGTFTGIGVLTAAPTSAPQGIALGDLNRDGQPDLVVANSGDDTVTVGIAVANNNGSNFTYTKYSTGPAGSAPVAVKIADINHDGIPDLIVANSGNNTIAVLAGNGDGTFRSPQLYPVDGTPRDVAVVDLNRDGTPDVVTANYVGSPIVTNVAYGQVTSNVATLTTNSYDYRSLIGQKVTVAGVTPDSFYNGTYTITAATGAQTISFALTHADVPLTIENPGGTATLPNGGDVGVLMGVSPGPLTPNYALSNLAAGQTPFGVAVADVNGDGKLDIAASDANFNSISNCGGTGNLPCDQVSLFLNNGTVSTPSFAAPANYPVGTFTRNVLFGDLNRDGKPDMIAISGTNASSVGTNRAEVLLNNGSGAFSPAVQYAAGTDIKYGVLGDFNGDGKLDLALTTGGSGIVRLYGNGDGTFQPPLTGLNGGIGPLQIATADFNSDGVLDFVVTNPTQSAVNVVLSQSGTYSQAVTYSTGAGTTPYGIALGDFNGDGALDLAITDQGKNGVIVMLGNKSTTYPYLPDGTFGPPVEYPAGNIPFDIKVVDYNLDGILDLVVASNGDNAVTLLQGVGDGSFRAPMNIAVHAGGGPSGIAFADLNGDGIPDLVTANQATNDVSILLSGKRSAVTNTVTTCTTPVASVVADFNNDKKNDMAVLNKGCNTVSIFVGDGNGNLTPAATPTITVGTTPTGIASGNFTSSGNVDLVTANSGSGNITVLLGNGDATFTAKPPISVGTQPTEVFVTDINGDGKADIAIVDKANNAVYVLLGNGDGTFGPPIQTSTQPGGILNTTLFGGPSAIVMGDLNGDGAKDMVIANSASNTVSVLINKNDGKGDFNAAVSYNVGSSPTALVLGDFNGDGKLDIAVANFLSGNVSILLNDGTGKFGAAKNFATGNGPNSIATLDYNNDKKLDLAVTNQGDNSVMVLLGNGDGTFQSGIVVGAASGPNSVSVASLTGSGSNDLIVTNGSGGNVTILLDNSVVDLALPCGTSSTAACSPMPFGKPITFSATVTPHLAGAPVPTGMVTFQENSSVLGNAPLVPPTSGTTSAAQALVGSLGAGNHTITVNYSGNSFFTSSSSTFTQQVNPVNGNPSVAATPDPSSVGEPVTIVATVSTPTGAGNADGSVSFTVNQSGSQVSLGTAQTLKNGQASLTVTSFNPGQAPTIGSYSITATYVPGASGNFIAGTPGKYVQSVTPATSTTTVSSMTPVTVFNQNVTFNVTVTSAGGTPTGSVGLVIDEAMPPINVPLDAQGNGTYSTQLLPVGKHVIRAIYSGDTNFSSSAAQPTAQLVNKAPVTAVISAGASSNPVNVGATAQFSASLSTQYGGTPMGTVTFSDNLGDFAATPATVSSNAASFTSPAFKTQGVHIITATYNGDANFATSNPDKLYLVVNTSAAFGTQLAVTAVPVAIFRQPINITTTVKCISGACTGTPGGQIWLIDDDVVLQQKNVSTAGCGAAPNVACATLTLNGYKIGQRPVTLLYSGDGTFGGNVSCGGSTACTVLNVSPQPHLPKGAPPIK